MCTQDRAAGEQQDYAWREESVVLYEAIEQATCGGDERFVRPSISVPFFLHFSISFVRVNPGSRSLPFLILVPSSRLSLTPSPFFLQTFPRLLALASLEHGEYGDEARLYKVITGDRAVKPDEDLAHADGVSASHPHAPGPTRAVFSSAGAPGIQRRSLASPLLQMSSHALIRGDVEATTSSNSPQDPEGQCGCIEPPVSTNDSSPSPRLGTVLAMTMILEALHAAVNGNICRAAGQVASLKWSLRYVEPAPRYPTTASAVPTKSNSRPRQWRFSQRGRPHLGLLGYRSGSGLRLADSREEWEAKKTKAASSRVETEGSPVISRPRSIFMVASFAENHSLLSSRRFSSYILLSS
ncbi:hypothetical protein D9619_011101 [Psilocybe cf. subviscida]|uniref:Uncharacterized protein n=1 Tax=Psilocybe cf. subviscida TaxID=2480587 RepID=A0A8H5BJ68_9AGAR|nr:hypothetical protein D9619_011101 [Psilocybe cf. subviscida]